MPLFLVKVRSHLKQWLYWKPPYNEQKKATTMLWSFAREKLLSLQNVKVAFLSVLLETLNRVLLIGDATEDPSHPKVVWPAPSECPTCRSQRTSRSSNFDPQIAFVQGTLWNLTNLVEHNIKVYAGQHLRPIDLTAFRGNKVVEKTLETSFFKVPKERILTLIFSSFPHSSSATRCASAVLIRSWRWFNRRLFHFSSGLLL